MTTVTRRAEGLGTEIYSRALEICWRLDELCRMSVESDDRAKWSDSTARQAYETLQRLMLKIREGRLHTSPSTE